MRISDWSSDVCSSDLADVHDVGRDVAGAGGNFLHVLGDFAGGLALLFDGGGDGGGAGIDFADGAGDAPDRGHRLAGRLLHVADLQADLARSLRSLRVEIGRASCRESVWQSV